MNLKTAPRLTRKGILRLSSQNSKCSATNEFALGNIQEQTRLTIENIRNILLSCGSSLASV
jgi:enamine deaminase RidA (YjgF/YER057c/UK114 family)